MILYSRTQKLWNRYGVSKTNASFSFTKLPSAKGSGEPTVVKQDSERDCASFRSLSHEKFYKQSFCTPQTYQHLACFHVKSSGRAHVAAFPQKTSFNICVIFRDSQLPGGLKKNDFDFDSLITHMSQNQNSAMTTLRQNETVHIYIVRNSRNNLSKYYRSGTVTNILHGGVKMEFGDLIMQVTPGMIYYPDSNTPETFIFYDSQINRYPVKAVGGGRGGVGRPASSAPREMADASSGRRRCPGAGADGKTRAVRCNAEETKQRLLSVMQAQCSELAVRHVRPQTRATLCLRAVHHREAVCGGSEGVQYTDVPVTPSRVPRQRRTRRGAVESERAQGLTVLYVTQP